MVPVSAGGGGEVWPIHRGGGWCAAAKVVEVMTQVLYQLGRFASRRPFVVIGGWLLVSVLVVGASSAFGKQLEDSFGAPGLDSQEATDLLAAAGSKEAGITAQVVLTDATEADVDRVRSAAADLPHVLAVGDPLVSPDGQVTVIRLQYPVLEDLSPVDLENLKELSAHERTGSPMQIELGGDLFFAFEAEQPGVGEVIGVLAAVVILLVAFGSIVAMGLPIGMALFGLGLGISSMSLIAYLVAIPSWVPVIGSMVGLGVGIDYALFLVTRQREHLALGLTVPEATGRTVATAGHTVVFAGGTVVISILGLAVAGVPFMTAGAIGVAVIVLIMVLGSLTLLPAFLGLAGTRLNRRSSTVVRVGTRWLRWGAHVSRHAVAYAVGGSVLLLGLAAPVLALQVGTPDEGSLPETRTERRAYDAVADGFGPGVNGPFVIAVDVSDGANFLPGLAAAVAADRGVASVTPPEVDQASGVATFVAFPTTGPQADATAETMARLRTHVLPPQAHLGGKTATFADVSGRVGERLPWFIGAVVLLSTVLLTVVFRSVLVPLKAAVLNLLSIGASFGVMVMVFQWGWGADLIGLGSTVPIVPFIPMFMFAIVFGLSMDYEVFLLSRVREEYVATGDSAAAVTNGIAKTGRLITSAALIMICVFLGFVTSSDPTTKMFGLGLAVAIFVDATVVRMVLVPAIMGLLGDKAWWFPRQLLRRRHGGAPEVLAVGEPPIGVDEFVGAGHKGGPVVVADRKDRGS